jgi:diguanylate cyclase (GGDEF)-like protein
MIVRLHRGGRLKLQPLRLTLRTKLLLVVLLCVGIPVVLMGSYLLDRNEEILAEKVRETLSNHLFRKSSQIDDWMWQRTREVTRWSASFVVSEGVEAFTHKTGDVARAQRDVNDYLASVLGHYQTYESLFVTDAQGKILAATRNEQWEEWATGLLTRPEAAKAGVVSPLHRSPFLGRPTLLALHAIQDRNDRNVAFFVERPDLRELLLLLNPPLADPAPEFWLLDAEGRILLRTGQVPANPGTEELPVVRPVPPEEAGAVVEATLPSLGRVVYGVRRLAGPSGGYLAATVPARTAFRALADARLRLLSLGVPALVLVLLVSFYAARSLLRPILLLSEGARRLSRGETDVSLPVTGNDELADLTRTFNDMSAKVREARQRLESLAITDELTQLYNRRHFGDTLEKEMRRSERDDRPLSLLLLDLDHFKQFNDRWGHTEGDLELTRVAAIVMKNIRATDTAFRYGGEELAVLLPSCPKHQALPVAEKIRAAVNARPTRGAATEKPFTTVSIGVATYPEDGQAGRALVDAADAALYAAKARGRDRVVLAGEEASSVEKAAGV